MYFYFLPASLIFLNIIDLHHSIFYYLIIILVLVFWLLFVIIFFKKKKVIQFYHCSFLEITWTLLPCILLFFILLPALACLFLFDHFLFPKFSVKVLGNQWYWSYTILNRVAFFKKINFFISFDAYFKQTSHFFQLNYFLTNNFLILPLFLKIRLLVTSNDVLHSFFIPAFGVKIDAVPGQINQIVFEIFKKGLFAASCAELCGTNHSAMPTLIKTLP